MGASTEWVPIWHEKVALAVDALGTPDFCERLRQAIASIVAFDVWMIFGYADRRSPRILDHNLAPERAATIINDYLVGPYLLDPFFEAAVLRRREGLGRLRNIAPDKFYSSEYYKRHYARTKIRDEVGFFVQLPAGASLVISVTRPLDRPVFGRGDMTRLRQVEPLVRALAQSHWSDLAAAFADDIDRGELLIDPIDRALTQMGSGVLTNRETEVMALILKGHSNGSVSENLGISAGTVKIHRKNIYQKLAVSSQAELFSRFIETMRTYFRQA